MRESTGPRLGLGWGLTRSSRTSASLIDGPLKYTTARAVAVTTVPDYTVVNGEQYHEIYISFANGYDREEAEKIAHILLGHGILRDELQGVRSNLYLAAFGDKKPNEFLKATIWKDLAVPGFPEVKSIPVVSIETEGSSSSGSNKRKTPPPLLDLASLDPKTTPVKKLKAAVEPADVEESNNEQQLQPGPSVPLLPKPKAAAPKSPKKKKFDPFSNQGGLKQTTIGSFFKLIPQEED